MGGLGVYMHLSRRVFMGGRGVSLVELLKNLVADNLTHLKSEIGIEDLLKHFVDDLSSCKLSSLIGFDKSSAGSHKLSLLSSEGWW